MSLADDWFATLKAGDVVAARTVGRYQFGDWERRVVRRATKSTVWLVPAYSHQEPTKITPRSRTWDIRPWTEQDQQRHNDIRADAQIRGWVERNVIEVQRNSKALDPNVRAAMLRVIAEVSDVAR